MTEEHKEPSDGDGDQLNKRLVVQVIEGQVEALASFRSRVEPSLRKRLLARGASEDEADDILCAVWSRCVPGLGGGGESLLAAYDGRSSPTTWLATVAVNRWLDRKRKETVHARWVKKEQDLGNTLPAHGETAPDGPLLALLKDALERAFQQCDAEALVLLRLVHVHGLSQRDLAAVWGCREYTISRHLGKAVKGISKATLAHIRQTDSHLELKWEDFLALCEHFSQKADANSTDVNV